MLYFAYGSNLDWDQLRTRCPSSRLLGIALLPDHKLVFTRKSVIRNCGVADAVPEKNQNIWGVVYEIADIEVGLLDSSEGYIPGREKNSYWRRECRVFMVGNKKHPMTVWTYFADQQPKPPLPSSAYKKQIINGAKYWNLPKSYIDELELIEATP